MADVTFGVKVPEDLKEQLQKLMSDSGLAGKDFMQQIINSYTLEKTKESIPVVAEDLKELQTLTQRINNIYLNLGYRIDTITKAKDMEAQSQLQGKDKVIVDLQSQIESLKLENKTLNEYYNESISMEIQFKKRIDELTNMYNDNKALVEEYKEKNDTLTGLVNEYKSFKEENETIKYENNNLKSENDKLNIRLEAAKDTLKMSTEKHEETINNLNSKHQEELLSLNNKTEEIKVKHSDELSQIKDKMEFEKDKALLAKDKEHQELINKLSDEYNHKTKQLLEENESYNRKVKELLDQLEDKKGLKEMKNL